MRWLLLSVVLLNSVLGEESDVNIKKRYSFNHPPFFDDYTIPVAVVSDEGRSNNKPIEVQTSEPLKESVTDTTKIEEYDIPVIKNTPLKVNLESSRTAKVSTKPRTSEIQIPVQVIYDTERISTYVPSKPVTTVKARPIRRRLKHRRLHRPDTATSPAITTSSTIATTKKEIIDEKSTDSSNVLSYEMRKHLFERVAGKPRKLPRERDPVVPILSNENHVYSHNGNFRYSYEGGDGTRAFSEGHSKIIDHETGESVVGGFSYTDGDGNDFNLSYTADENGYRPVGSHLPTPPPIPPAIARALAYVATSTTPKPFTKIMNVIMM